MQHAVFTSSGGVLGQEAKRIIRTKLSCNEWCCMDCMHANGFRAPNNPPPLQQADAHTRRKPTETVRPVPTHTATVDHPRRGHMQLQTVHPCADSTLTHSPEAVHGHMSAQPRQSRPPPFSHSPNHRAA